MPTEQRHFLVEAPERLDAFLAARLAGEGVSRETVKAWIRAGDVLVDGKAATKPGMRLAAGQAATAPGARAPSESLVRPEPGELAVRYVDEHIAVLMKPAGLVVHPGAGFDSGTLVNRLAARFPEILGQEGMRPGIVHRLDKDTSGLMVVALTEGARLALSRSFAEREVEKRYLCFTVGVPAVEEKTLDKPIGRHPVFKTKMTAGPGAVGAKPARSLRRTLWIDPGGRAALAAVDLFTGRTHQIRVHLADEGTPLLGDATYASRESREAAKRLHPGLSRRVLLHATRLSFSHPATGERLTFVEAPPLDFKRAACLLARQSERIALVGAPGSGKSLVLRLLGERGAATFSADEAVRRLCAPGGEGLMLIRRRFGDRFLGAGGKRLDRLAVLAAFAESDQTRREFESLLHPLVFHELALFWRENAGKPLAVAEIPLALEAGFSKTGADRLVTVFRPDSARLACLSGERGLDGPVIAALEAAQFPQAVKVRAADWVLDNSGDEADLERLVGALVRELKRTRRRGWFAAAARIIDRFKG